MIFEAFLSNPFPFCCCFLQFFLYFPVHLETQGSWLPWEPNWEPREGPSLGIQFDSQGYQKLFQSTFGIVCDSFLVVSLIFHCFPFIFLSNWKLNIKKIIDIKPQSFSPRPKIDSSLLLFTPKQNNFELKDAKNLEMITRIFFSQRRKMLKKPFNQVFKNSYFVSTKLTFL